MCPVCVVQEDLDVRTSAMGVVAAVSNLLGSSTLKVGGLRHGGGLAAEELA